jgi:hypothetical protein
MMECVLAIVRVEMKAHQERMMAIMRPSLEQVEANEERLEAKMEAYPEIMDVILEQVDQKPRF